MFSFLFVISKSLELIPLSSARGRGPIISSVILKRLEIPLSKRELNVVDSGMGVKCSRFSNDNCVSDKARDNARGARKAFVLLFSIFYIFPTRDLFPLNYISCISVFNKQCSDTVRRHR